MRVPKSYILGTVFLLLGACTISPHFFHAIYRSAGSQTSWVHVETSSESGVLTWSHFYTNSAYIAPAAAQINKPLVLLEFERISQNDLLHSQRVFTTSIHPKIKEASLLFQLDLHSAYPSFSS